MMTLKFNFIGGLPVIKTVPLSCPFHLIDKVKNMIQAESVEILSVNP